MSAFLGTNLLVRYLPGDIPELAEQAAAVIDNASDLFVTDAVLAEPAYVLRSRYQVQRELIVDSLLALLGKTNLLVFSMDKTIVVQALLMCRPSGRVSFDDALLWAAARSSGVNVVYAVDKRFPEDGIEVRRPGS